MLFCTVAALCASLHFQGSVLGVTCDVIGDSDGAVVHLRGFPFGSLRGNAALKGGRLATLDSGFGAALKRRGCRIVDVDATGAFRPEARVVVVVDIPFVGVKTVALHRVDEE